MSKLLFHATLAALMLSAAPSAYAQEVSSRIRGTVTDAASTPVAGARVVVAKPATGTRIERTTDAAGGFNVAGLRVGGPYQVSIDALGFESQAVDDVTTTIGEPFVVDATLTTAGAEVVVSGRRLRGTQTGERTVLDREAIRGVATVNCDIRDLVRRDPLASFDPNPRGRAISIAGGNPRTHRFSIDGVTVNDTFGLNSGDSPRRAASSASKRSIR